MSKFLHQILCFFGIHTFSDWNQTFKEEGNFLDAEIEELKDFDECIYCHQRFERDFY